ncbi:MAG: glucose-6-phosphate dehydrogenase assembly protein OpcA [Aeromicrobium sp.]|uniref:glucose-6-phosphate dehydrogenase assembly protein OpcA n=1 Tax=Aeromicrobium sp. TaxID=1871063 RepID=UPI003C473315
MQITLEHTNASTIAKEMVRARLASGSPAMDMVLTLIVVCDDDTVEDALSAATTLSQEHPSRVIGVILGKGTGGPDLHAKIRVGSDRSGESILLRMSGQLVKHAESAVLPLLLPDSPVVVWWPGSAPSDPASDPIGAFGTRRLTDAEATSQAVRNLTRVAKHYTPGDTDLSWTRLTPWRALLAAALDQVQSPVTGGSISAGPGNPAGVLLEAWLESRLGVPITWHRVDADQIMLVTLETKAGEVRIEREDENSCTFSVPGSAPRTVPLARRTLAELLAEDLRRLDSDQIYGDTVQYMLAHR